MRSDEIDWVAVLRHVTPRNVAKWILVIGFGVFVVASLIWYAGYLWGQA